MKTTLKELRATVKGLFEESSRRQEAQKRAAGKHECKWRRSGDVAQVTSGDKILKRRKVLAYFYECRLCGDVKTEELKR